MHREFSKQQILHLQQTLESWTGTRWKVRNLGPDGYWIATSENESDSIKLLASDAVTALPIWRAQIAEAGWCGAYPAIGISTNP